MMTLEEFRQFYFEKGFLPNDVGTRKNKLNEKQIKTRHKKYLKANERKEYTIDEEWQELKTKLDLSECSLLKRLREEQMFDEIAELQEKAGWLLRTIDPAHVFSRSSNPHMKYDVENVVPLNRYSHSCLDSMRDPISGESIDLNAHRLFWMFIVGIERFTSLEGKTWKS